MTEMYEMYTFFLRMYCVQGSVCQVATPLIAAPTLTFAATAIPAQINTILQTAPRTTPLLAAANQQGLCCIAALHIYTVPYISVDPAMYIGATCRSDKSDMRH